MPRLSAAQNSPSGDQLSIERQVSCDSSCARDPAGVHQYAVPCSIGAAEKSEIVGVGAGDSELAMTSLKRTSAPSDDGKKLTGNMEVVF